MTTAAGNGIAGFSGDGGPSTSASLNFPFGVAVDTVGNVFFSDSNNDRIRFVSTGSVIVTVAGNGMQGSSGDGGPATSAKLNSPAGVVMTGAGNFFFADRSNMRIRGVTGGIITTLAGNGMQGFSGDGGPAADAALNFPAGVGVDGFGNVYVVDQSNNRIRFVASMP
jgi:hypothetical protein